MHRWHQSGGMGVLQIYILLTLSSFSKSLDNLFAVLCHFDIWVMRQNWQITGAILLGNQHQMTMYAAYGGLAPILWVCVTLLDVLWCYIVSASSQKKRTNNVRSGGLPGYSSQIRIQIRKQIQIQIWRQIGKQIRIQIWIQIQIQIKLSEASLQYADLEAWRLIHCTQAIRWRQFSKNNCIICSIFALIPDVKNQNSSVFFLPAVIVHSLQWNYFTFLEILRQN